MFYDRLGCGRSDCPEDPERSQISRFVVEIACVRTALDLNRVVLLGHDESTPAINRVLHRGIPGARWVLMEGCSHLAHVEAPERYLSALEGFLESFDSRVFVCLLASAPGVDDVPETIRIGA